MEGFSTYFEGSADRTGYRKRDKLNKTTRFLVRVTKQMSFTGMCSLVRDGSGELFCAGGLWETQGSVSDILSLQVRALQTTVLLPS